MKKLLAATVIACAVTAQATAQTLTLYCAGTVYWLNRYRPLAARVVVDLNRKTIGFNNRYWAFITEGTGRDENDTTMFFHRDAAPFSIDGSLDTVTGQFDAEIVYANNYTEEWLGRCR